MDIQQIKNEINVENRFNESSIPMNFNIYCYYTTLYSKTVLPAQIQRLLIIVKIIL